MRKIRQNQKPINERDYGKYPFRNLSLTDLEREVWKDIPSFDGYYCVSNYGRVWSLARPVHSSTGQHYFTKDCIRKQYLTKHYNSFTRDYTEQLSVHVRYERLDYSFKVNRLVYDLFVKRIRETNKKILIVHKDGDNCNNRYNNLVAMSGTELYSHGLEIGRRPRSTRMLVRKKTAKWPESNAPRPVIQYTLKGKKIKEYKSVADASKAVKASRGSVRDVLKKNLKQLFGFVFRYKGDPYNGEHSDFSWEKRVTQYSLDGKKITTHSSVKNASLKTGVHSDSISKCALRKMRSANGYVWRYNGDTYDGEYEGKIRNFARPLVQFSLDGKTIARYSTVNEAWRKTGFSTATLLDCAFKRTKVSHGFVWRFEGDVYDGAYKTYRIGKPVTQHTLEEKKIKTYPTIEAAARYTGLTPDNIQKNVNGQNKTAGGFIWRYATKKEINRLPSFQGKKENRLVIPGVEVVQYSVEGKKIAEFKSLTRASLAVKSNYTNISAVLDVPDRTAAGFVWRTKGTRYYGEIEKNPPANRAKTVTQYDMRGNNVATFQSTKHAEKMTGISSSTIVAAANGKLKTTGGFFWQYGRGPEQISVANYDRAPNRKPVMKYSLRGKFVAEYPSISEAARKEGISAPRISEVIRGTSNSAAGHLWKLKT